MSKYLLIFQIAIFFLNKTINNYMLLFIGDQEWSQAAKASRHLSELMEPGPLTIVHPPPLGLARRRAGEFFVTE